MLSIIKLYKAVLGNNNDLIVWSQTNEYEIKKKSLICCFFFTLLGMAMIFFGYFQILKILGIALISFWAFNIIIVRSFLLIVEYKYNLLQITETTVKTRGDILSQLDGLKELLKQKGYPSNEIIRISMQYINNMNACDDLNSLLSLLLEIVNHIDRLDASYSPSNGTQFRNNSKATNKELLRIKELLIILSYPAEAKLNSDNLKKHYRLLIKTYHPDIYKGDDAVSKTQSINDSYNELSNLLKRIL